MPVFFCVKHGAFGAGSELCECLKEQLTKEREELAAARDCVKCGTALAYATGVGEYCPAKDCDALDNQMDPAMSKCLPFHEPGNDKLGTMFEVQERFQMRVGAPRGSEDRMQHITEQALAAMVELGEFMQELPWKSWKTYKPEDIDLTKAAVELVDVQHFIINLALALDMSATEFYFQFMQKNAINSKRQDAGY